VAAQMSLNGCHSEQPNHQNRRQSL